MNRRYTLFPDLRHVVVLVLVGWFIFNLFQTVQYVRGDYSPVPIRDYWREVQLWPHFRAFIWNDLWTQHSEHRILFPELVYVLDMFLLRGQLYLPIAMNGFCYLGVWLALTWAAYSQKVVESPAREMAVLLAGIVIAWKGCSTVIATPSAPITLLQFAGALSLAALSKLSETGKTKYLVAVITAAVVDTYSSGNGMLMWIVLIIGAAILRVSKKQLLALIVSGVLFTGIYFIGYKFLPSLIGVNIRHPILLAEYLCGFFSMPFGAVGSEGFMVVTGALNLLLMAICFGFAWQRGLLKSRLGVMLFGLYLFTFLSAALTAAGRMDIKYSVPLEARPWRYLPLPTVAWALVFMAVIWLAAEAFSQNWAIIAGAVIACLCFKGLANTAQWVEETRIDEANAQVAAVMLKNAVFDPVEVERVFPSAEFVERHIPILKEDRKSVYSHRDGWIGQDLAKLHPEPEAVPGVATHVMPVPGGLEILGWTSEHNLTQDHAVLFVDGANKVIGFGGQPAAGLPRDLSTIDTPDSLAFVGFISQPVPGSKLMVYIRSPHEHSVHPLRFPIEVPTYLSTSSMHYTAPLPNITWQPGATWKQRAYMATSQNGQAPLGDVYASWNGSDAKTGVIRTLPFAAPVEHCIALPVLSGGSATGQSVQILDADTNSVVASLPLHDGLPLWTRWQIPTPPSIRNIAVVADDEGTDYEQWLAVATPERCP